jgi:hypothetical protein
MKPASDAKASRLECGPCLIGAYSQCCHVPCQTNISICFKKDKYKYDRTYLMRIFYLGDFFLRTSTQLIVAYCIHDNETTMCTRFPSLGYRAQVAMSLSHPMLHSFKLHNATIRDENGSDMDGYHRYYICFHISVRIRIGYDWISTS